jgi:hypothetical protein
VPAASTDYRPRAPESDVLRRVICEHLETFLDRATSQRDGETLPGFVRREFEKYVTCGSLAAASVRGVAALGARAGVPVRRWGDAVDLPAPPDPGRWRARLDGFDLHAGVAASAVLRRPTELISVH